jgi:hypothetical protein
VGGTEGGRESDGIGIRNVRVTVAVDAVGGVRIGGDYLGAVGRAELVPFFLGEGLEIVDLVPNH